MNFYPTLHGVVLNFFPRGACHSHEGLGRLPADSTGKLKLAVNEEKTRICKVPEGEFDFLGYTFGRMYSARTGQVGDICCHGQLSASGVWPQTVLGQVRNPTRWREGHEPRGRKPHLVRVRLFLGSRLSASGHDGLPLDGRRDSPAGSSPHSHSPE